MGIIVSVVRWLVFGALVGALARFVLPGRQEMSLLMTAGLGVVGSFVGGAIAYLIWGAGTGWGQPSGWIMSLVGAVIALLIYTRVKSSPKE